MVRIYFYGARYKHTLWYSAYGVYSLCITYATRAYKLHKHCIIHIYIKYIFIRNSSPLWVPCFSFWLGWMLWGSGSEGLNRVASARQRYARGGQGDGMKPWGTTIVGGLCDVIDNIVFACVSFIYVVLLQNIVCSCEELFWYTKLIWPQRCCYWQKISFLLVKYITRYSIAAATSSQRHEFLVQHTRPYRYWF